jgi:deoxyhypusine monooxygenase
MEHPAASDALLAVLKDTQEHPMVRHECAEALGSIAKPSCLDALREYSADEARAVRESCVVALDMHAYWTQFYAMHKGSSEEEEVVQQ